MKIPVGPGGGSKHGDKSFDRILGIGIPDFLIKLMSCHGFLKNINYVVILKRPKCMFNTFGVITQLFNKSTLAKIMQVY